MRDVSTLVSKTDELTYKVPVGLKRVPWIETLLLSSEPSIRSIEDTVKLEKAFHDASLFAVKEGYRRLAALNVPAVRPGDFLAETLRDDRTMAKVKAKLADEAARIKAVEDRKRVQAEKKFAKKGANKQQKKKFQQTPEDDDLKNLKTLEQRKDGGYSGKAPKSKAPKSKAPQSKGGRGPGGPKGGKGTKRSDGGKGGVRKSLFKKTSGGGKSSRGKASGRRFKAFFLA
ncbi:hypothetical protein C9890_0624 [Perkinsus sp. BL_2016]|nr:hypothetical protein C9890_0624 [Perkinsus sp. BL_2016]